MRIELGVLLALCALGNCVAQDRITRDDPRPQGRLSLRELSLCEPPEGRPDWCTWPHEVRDFVNRRDDCDHWRGEPWPDEDTAAIGVDRQARIERSKEISDGLRDTCTGTDRRLRELKRVYAFDKEISRALSEYETDIEAGDADAP